LSYEKERAKEDISHRYHSLWFILVRVGVVALIFPAVMVLKFYRPLYSTPDVIVMLAVGIMLGAIYVRSHEMLAKSYERKLADLDKEEAPAKPS
jgi:vancomycin permeability regulator SanA